MCDMTDRDGTRHTSLCFLRFPTCFAFSSMGLVLANGWERMQRVKFLGWVGKDLVRFLSSCLLRLQRLWSSRVSCGTVTRWNRTSWTKCALYKWQINEWHSQVYYDSHKIVLNYPKTRPIYHIITLGDWRGRSKYPLLQMLNGALNRKSLFVGKCAKTH